MNGSRYNGNVYSSQINIRLVRPLTENAKFIYFISYTSVIDYSLTLMSNDKTYIYTWYANSILYVSCIIIYY